MEEEQDFLRISFWQEEVEEDFDKYERYLLDNTELSNYEINRFLEKIYNSVCKEYGD